MGKEHKMYRFETKKKGNETISPMAIKNKTKQITNSNNFKQIGLIDLNTQIIRLDFKI